MPPIGVFPVEPVNVKTAPPVSVTVDGGSLGIAGKGKAYNMDYLVADMEVPFAIPDGTKSYEVRAKSSKAFVIAFDPGDTTNAPIDVSAGSTYNKDGLNTVGLVVYIKSSNAPETFQIILYT